MFIFYISVLSQILSQLLLKLIFLWLGWQLSILFYLGGQGLRTQTCCIKHTTSITNITTQPAASDNNNKRVKYEGRKPSIFLFPVSPRLLILPDSVAAAPLY